VRHRGARAVTIALLVVAGLAAGRIGSGPERIEIRIHYSHYDPSSITVPYGVPITFVLINEDPIDHEWLLGDAAFQERHRLGTETHHSGLPNEISIDALSTVETVLTFHKPQTLQYICHLPGHEAYGMVGTLTII
ncbi:MAG TPA: cupredoxin domain-containing protein, partial [Candidatus Saccharimonadales bacterium]|nr:cupredoxin domain-containing protein [Candidatus Saccharimonadales bacterium]